MLTPVQMDEDIEPGILELEVEPPVVEEDNFIRREKIILEGPTILGTMKLPEARKFEKKKTSCIFF